MNTYILYKIKNILKYAFFSVILFFLIIQFIVAKSDFNFFQLSFAFLYGLTVGIIFESTSSVKFYKLTFISRTIIRATLLVFSIILIFIAILKLLSPEQWDNLHSLSDLFQSQRFQNSVVSILVLTFFIVLSIQLEKHLGNGFIFNFLFSKYEKPIEETRVVMFLDLKDSTTIAEKIGHLRFVEFINRTYKIMSKSVIKNNAEILKYVGDEVILTWTRRNGMRNNNPVNFYFDFKKDLESFYDDFYAEYGVKPVFKAGLNKGIVTASFIGHLKKQMDYSGDTMNTTARIQALCNSFDANLLISKNYAEELGLFSNKKYKLTDLGDTHLKGKERKVPIVKVELSHN